MPRYFYNLYNDEVTMDEEGCELPDDDAARARCRHEVLVLAADSILMHAHLVLHHKVEVLAADARMVASISFGDAISVQE